MWFHAIVYWFQMLWLPALIFGFLIFAFWDAVYAGIKLGRIWKFDERHPDARRCCKHCGNHQEFYVYNTYPQEIPIGWEFVGRVNACNKCNPDPSLVDE